MVPAPAVCTPVSAGPQIRSSLISTRRARSAACLSSVVGSVARRSVTFLKPDSPCFACQLDLTGLPPEYVGGQLTTNTLQSRTTLGAETDPPGYTQASIATMRVWKKR